MSSRRHKCRRQAADCTSECSVLPAKLWTTREAEKCRFASAKSLFPSCCLLGSSSWYYTIFLNYKVKTGQAEELPRIFLIADPREGERPLTENLCTDSHPFLSFINHCEAMFTCFFIWESSFPSPHQWTIKVSLCPGKFLFWSLQDQIKHRSLPHSLPFFSSLVLLLVTTPSIYLRSLTILIFKQALWKDHNWKYSAFNFCGTKGFNTKLLQKVAVMPLPDIFSYLQHYLRFVVDKTLG